MDKIFDSWPGHVFVFGSNLAGVHGAGAAAWAYRFAGAHWEVGEGLMGESYAIPTKNRQIQTLPLEEIEKHVKNFLVFAESHPELEFFVTRIGCGLAGYKDDEIAPLFYDVPQNVELPFNWGRKPMSNRIESFSGTYRFLSNFWMVEISLYDVMYKSVEHAYQAAKTVDEAYKKRIQDAATPGEAKRLGKSAPMRPDWEAVKVDFMRYLVSYKFGMHPELGKKLLATGNKELVEGNTWGDVFWGVCKGQGQNWLGRILMETRERLRQGTPTK